MSDKSGIEWTDATWNPVTGCSHISPGCDHCYAETVTRRFRPDWKPWTPANAEHNVVLHPERLGQPFVWKRPRRIFVNSMSDLFHRLVPDEFIFDVYRAMARSPQHTFQVLTKRPDRAAAWYRRYMARLDNLTLWTNGLLPNVWLGTSVESQQFDSRITALLSIPAAVRFISAEPLLGPLDLKHVATGPDVWRDVLGGLRLTSLSLGGPFPRLNWVIVGGESGPGARPCDVEWIYALIRDCRDAEVPIFVKQLGAQPTMKHEWAMNPITGKGGDWTQWPDDLRVREFPRPKVLRTA